MSDTRRLETGPRANAQVTDEELLLAYGSTSEPSALETLIARHFAPACRVARAALRDPASAEDAAEEAVVALARSAGRFKAGRRFRPWWGTILRNAIRGQERSRRRRLHRERQVALLGPTKAAPAEDAALATGQLSDALLALPVDLRLPIVLHYYEGRSHEEVAELVGCPTGTASSRIRRGLERLRASLASAGALGLGVEETLRADRDALSRHAPAPPGAARIREAARHARRVGLVAKTLLAGTIAIMLTVGIALRGEPPRSSATTPLPVGSATASAAPRDVPREATARPGAADVDSITSETAEASDPTRAPRGQSLPAEGEPTITVLVVDMEGRPQAGADVFLGMQDWNVGLRIMNGICNFQRSQCRTDGRGVAFIPVPEDLRRWTSVAAAARKGLALGVTDPLALDEAGDTRFVVVVRPPEKSLPERGAVVLTLKDGQGPLVGTVATVTHLPGMVPGWSVEQPTDERARLALNDVEPGHHAFAVAVDAADRGSERIEVDVEPGVVTRRDVELPPLSAIHGSVEAPPGTDPTGAKLQLETFDRDAKVTFDGRTYRVGGLSAGINACHLRATLDGFAPVELELTPVRGKESEGPPVRFGDGVTVSGRLLDPGNGPCAAAAVSLEPTGSIRLPEVVARSASDGSFTVKGLRDGVYLLKVSAASGSAERYVDVGDRPIDLGPITLKEDAPAPLPERARVQGRVTDPAGKPVKGAKVRAASRSYEWEAESDEDGRYELSIWDGRYEIGAIEGDRCSALGTIEPAPGAELSFGLVLEQSCGSVRGRVLSPEPVLEDEVSVTLIHGGMDAFRSVGAGSGGSFDFARLIPGTYTLEVKGRYSTPYEDTTTVAEVVVVAGAESEVEIKLPRLPSEKLVLRVIGAPERSDLSAQARWDSSDPSVHPATPWRRSSEGGVVTLDHVPASRLHVAIKVELERTGRDQGTYTLLRDIDVPPGGPPSPALVRWNREEMTAGLVGRLASKSDAYVWALGSDLRAAYHVSEETGFRFSLLHLPAGRYRVVATESSEAPLNAQGTLVEVVAGATTTVKDLAVSKGE